MGFFYLLSLERIHRNGKIVHKIFAFLFLGYFVCCKETKKGQFSTILQGLGYFSSQHPFLQMLLLWQSGSSVAGAITPSWSPWRCCTLAAAWWRISRAARFERGIAASAIVSFFAKLPGLRPSKGCIRLSFPALQAGLWKVVPLARREVGM